jgi:hypothetical protein
MWDVELAAEVAGDEDAPMAIHAANGGQRQHKRGGLGERTLDERCRQV